jgi:dynein heavy chain
MTTMIMDGDNELNKVELDFFLKGNTSLEQITREKPYAWLSQNGWKDLQKLATLGDVWKTIVDDVEHHGKEWKQWYDVEQPENTDIPCEYAHKLSRF